MTDKTDELKTATTDDLLAHKKPDSLIDQAVQGFKEDQASQPESQPKKKGKKSKFAFTPKKKSVVSEQEALGQIELLFDRYRIDIEEMWEDDKEQAESVESSANVILKSIMLGEVEIYNDEKDNSKIKVDQHIQHRSAKGNIEKITYGELEGNDSSSMPTGKKINEYDRMYALLGSMNEDAAGENTVRKLRSSDLKTALALSILFLVQ